MACIKLEKGDGRWLCRADRGAADQMFHGGLFAVNLQGRDLLLQILVGLRDTFEMPLVIQPGAFPPTLDKTGHVGTVLKHRPLVTAIAPSA